jgi:hypothetical protein
MSLFPDAEPHMPTYDEKVGALLANVADLLLAGRQDWNTLERLEAALTPPAKKSYEYLKKSVPHTSDRISYGDGSGPLTYGGYTMGGGIASSSDAVKALESVYSEKMMRMLKEEIAENKTAVFKSLYSGDGPLPSHSHTTNPAEYITEFKPLVDPITKDDIYKYIKKIRRDDDDSMGMP